MKHTVHNPDFFIVGAQRSGTTSLYEYLRQHPQLYLSPKKETHYFSQDRVRIDSDLVVQRQADYLRLFAPARETQLTGEASPSYLWHPDAPTRIYAQSPRAKIIILLRNPIARAYSQYQMDWGDGLRPFDFYDLVHQEYEHGDKVYGTGHLYVELGLYGESVARYLDTFGRDQVLVLSFKELQKCPSAVVAQIVQFLGADLSAAQMIDTSSKFNAPRAPRNPAVHRLLRLRWARQIYRATLPPSARRWMQQFFFTRPQPKPIDRHAIEYLMPIFEADAALLESETGITLADLRHDWRKALG